MIIELCCLMKSEREDPHFRLRGQQGSRLESFSDGVFALAVTLVLISTNPPDTFEALWAFLHQLLPFGLCMAAIFWIWNLHRTYFRRYGLQDQTTVFYNALLLSLTLFFVYPLRFFAGIMGELIPFWLGRMWGEHPDLPAGLIAMIPAQKIPHLLYLYGIGMMAVFGVYLLMYRHAYRLRHLLELNEYEVLTTRWTMRYLLLHGAVPLLSVLLLLCGVGGKQGFLVAGLTYNLHNLAFVLRHWEKKSFHRLAVAAQAAQEAPPSAISGDLSGADEAQNAL